MVISSPCLTDMKNLLVHKAKGLVVKTSQTVYGLTFYQNYMVLQTHLASRFSIHLVVYNEELTIPGQTATGKGISNPLMAGSLPKITKST
ncbi:hypothetical protein Tco_0045111 [Tanacetum coccineum]